MNKKILLFAIILSGFGLSYNVPVFAEEVVTEPITLDENFDTSDTTETVSLPSSAETGDSGSAPISNTGEDTTITPTSETELEEGTSGEPEVVCASTDEPGCEDAEITEETDPETWPLIVSLSALGATIVIVIIINLFGRKK